MINYLLQCCDEYGCGKTYTGDLKFCPHCGASDMFAKNASHLIPPTDYGYDIETFPDTFTAHFTHIATGTRWRFEISHRVNQSTDLVQFMFQLRDLKARGVGFNNEGFDYPVLHFIAQNPQCTVEHIYNKAMSIIKGDDRWGHFVWPRERLFTQLDLFKIHHYDNVAKSTSLKALEFAMQMDNIQDLPFEVGSLLNDEQREVLHGYNVHDVHATCLFYVRSLSEIKLRESLSELYHVDMLNYSDSKIGSTILIKELEKAGIQCFNQIPGQRKTPRQTPRPSINLSDVIFNYVKFEHPEFERIRAHLASMTIRETKGVFTGLHALIDGLEYHFGLGGLHMSVEPQIVESSDTHQLIDVDVASYYPNLAIKNGMYPAHLGIEFGDIYDAMYQKRSSYAKGTPENAALKIALNASYGNSNNQHSPLYDPFYTMQTTINGQLLLCMLVEQLIKVPGLRMVQCNTDGVTYLCPREYVDHTRALCRWWEQLTQLELEEALYSRMMIRDVNNYIAEYEGGKLKRKGTYEYNVQYHQDPSARIVAKAAEAHLVRGENITEFITKHRDPYDFCIRAKVPRSNNLVMEWSALGVELPMANIVRYFVSKAGGTLTKISPAKGKVGAWKRKAGISDAFCDQVIAENKGDKLDVDGVAHDERIHTKNKSVYAEGRTAMCKGWLSTDCSNMKGFDWSQINYDYYIAEAEKIVKPLIKTPL